MSLHVPITKMHGTANDFVILDARTTDVGDLAAFARAACDRRTGIGADGVLAIGSSQIADARMRVLNADGSEAEMCGNGMRCVARYLAEAGEGERLRVETLGGIIETEVLRRAPSFDVRLGLGAPEIEPRRVGDLEGWSVRMGNPHAVVFVPSLEAIDLDAFARSLQGTPAYPDGVNVHLVATEEGGLAVRHWERGVGATMACGTGAVSCAVAGIVAGVVRSPVTVRVPGGVLTVEWDGAGSAFLTGPAVRVFDGTFAYEGDRVRA